MLNFVVKASVIHHSVPPTDCVVEDEAASIVEVVVLVVSLFARTAPRPSGRTLIAPGKSRPLTWNANRADELIATAAVRFSPLVQESVNVYHSLQLMVLNTSMRSAKTADI